MQDMTHIEIREALKGLNIRFKFADPFDEDTQQRWAAVGRAYSEGIMSLETAVRLLSITNPEEEITRIQEDKKNTDISNVFEPTE
jgi:hypothetical protein